MDTQRSIQLQVSLEQLGKLGWLFEENIKSAQKFMIPSVDRITVRPSYGDNDTKLLRSRWEYMFRF